MREILFRGKRKDFDKWAVGSLIQAEEYCCILESEEAVHPMDYPYLYGEMGTFDGKATPIIPETVGQYTGMTDKNGKKIFEGDVIDTPDRLVAVVWLNANSQFDLTFIKYAYDKRIINFRGIEMRDLYLYEVIGNIHDNPELLKGGVQ